jgi:zinc transporter 9
VAVLLEDSAAVFGLFIAASCLALSYILGNPIFDAVGSILIGVLLGTF